MEKVTNAKNNEEGIEYEVWPSRNGAGWHLLNTGWYWF